MKVPGSVYGEFGKLFLTIALPLCILTLFLFVNDGLKLTYDSHDYIAAGESIQNFLEGTNAEGAQYIHRGPMLPAYLHFFSN